ncbi:MAG TPA: hypothetical protein DEP35_20820 [Deltaproteobacteria bacterium]|nr:hypothetical protein [Deltaproteobacteria bacterium]
MAVGVDGAIEGEAVGRLHAAAPSRTPPSILFTSVNLAFEKKRSIRASGPRRAEPAFAQTGINGLDRAAARSGEHSAR